MSNITDFQEAKPEIEAEAFLVIEEDFPITVNPFRRGKPHIKGFTVFENGLPNTILVPYPAVIKLPTMYRSSQTDRYQMPPEGLSLCNVQRRSCFAQTGPEADK